MNIPDKFLFGITTSEYRPCTLLIPTGRSVPTRERALFHRWTHESQPVKPGLAKGSQPGGQLSQTLGIVETENGRVRLVRPEYITFTDTQGVMDQFAWDDEEGET